ncbi:TetR/AcrR family transcriptional regulator [Nocardioides anomalus]|uniref:TetR/AcrR family transcriptional regulator n=1 Tax=Nocardioides anomalus TaxID=2712223 RepID=A0A6G6WAT1_9ACTN|nr:TetR/AcrR family transcriptional regulator [Nocardioides anomalus]QIG42334.1 TetR/AcrR family transcriptional regulator [Nocardioides anomalus]
MSTDRERTWQAGPVRVRVTLPPGKQPEPRKAPLTLDRIVDAAMALMKRDGYDRVSMRSLARELDTGPASLYAHVANKDELDQHVVDRISRLLDVPEPDPERWQEQLKQVMRDMRRLYREHPGSARAAMGMIPSMDGGLRAADAMMAIALAGGITPQAAAWFCDICAAFVGAVAYEETVWTTRENSTPAGEGDRPRGRRRAAPGLRGGDGRPVPGPGEIRRGADRGQRGRAVRLRRGDARQRPGGRFGELPLNTPAIRGPGGGRR